MSVQYSQDPSSVNFATDGPRAFQQTAAIVERDRRRARPVDAERKQALADLADNVMPPFWGNGGGGRAVQANTHPFSHVSSSGSRTLPRSLQVPVPAGATSVTITKGSSGHFAQPENQTLRPGFQQVTVALLHGEQANVSFAAASGAQLGFCPVSYEDAVDA
jgi:hypothetical protein